MKECFYCGKAIKGKDYVEDPDGYHHLYCAENFLLRMELMDLKTDRKQLLTKIKEAMDKLDRYSHYNGDCFKSETGRWVHLSDIQAALDKV